MSSADLFLNIKARKKFASLMKTNMLFLPFENGKTVKVGKILGIAFVYSSPHENFHADTKFWIDMSKEIIQRKT